MRNILANTLFVGRRHHHLTACHSTNDVAAAQLTQQPPPEGTLYTTDHQTRGRGQRGRTWEAAAGKNLLFTLVLYPTFLAVPNQFALSTAVALGVRAALEALVGSLRWQVKWPNDLYADGRKVGGILIENAVRQVRLQHSLVGIGLNVNQTTFGVGAAASLRTLTGLHWPPEVVLARVLEGIEAHYLRLRAGEVEGLQRDYLRHLYRLGEAHPFARPDGTRFTGTIQGVDAAGRLEVRAEGATHHFSVGEVRFE
ncbi:MAG: biotin--[acetyl-CoA-carboxylase] ligase [Catalinimonas sp.]